MYALESVDLSCPWCGEPQCLSIDPGEGGHQFTEDCGVCCQPMLITVSLDPRDGTVESIRCEREG
jgi:hypothetical protein